MQKSLTPIVIGHSTAAASQLNVISVHAGSCDSKKSRWIMFYTHLHLQFTLTVIFICAHALTYLMASF